MRNLKRAFWGGLALLMVLWLIAEPAVFQSASFFAWRDVMVQLTGVIAMGSMSVAMVLALRPRWPEQWLGGLDKMYRLHKWLGITALATAIIHWLWSQGPKWAVGWGLLEKPARGPRAPIENPLEALFRTLRGAAEDIGEWAFYAAALMMVLALVTRFPYRWFFKTHRLLAVAYLVLAFHAVVLLKFSYWITPLGALMAVLLAAGTGAAIVVLLRRVASKRKVPGKIAALNYFPGARVLAIEAEVQGWPGHNAGQFAFVTADTLEGAHPYTIASGWQAENPRLRIIAKELGDYTRHLRETLRVGQDITIEGPYGCFTFDDHCPHQIWISGGIGITPFIARMEHMAARKEDYDWPQGQKIDLFHSTSEADGAALEKLAASAQAANVQLHIIINTRDGYLTGERVRAVVPEWRKASIWFCGPTGFGEALKRDFVAQGFPVRERFHQELFAMR
ncbi:MAG: ferric reductase-like transmembrane domain-containing protein [Pseudomonadales bacterium]|jgi:predicted ferric reductase|nr:ferric reductase-like transmembrane domain-containing protein [Pseudomonadales bacterium]